MSSSGSSSSSSGFSELDFELSVGKALDTLRKDYADLLVRPPDYSIYCKDMELVDPSGVELHGLRSYQNAWRLLHTLIRFLYCPDKSAMTSVRMCYDPVKRNIRIHWNAQAVPREIFGGTRSVVNFDGISVYEFDRATGEIVQHRFEQLIRNNQAIRPEEGVVAAMSKYHGRTVPSFFVPEKDDLFTVPFQSSFHQRQSLFSEGSSDSSKDDSGSALNSYEASRSDGDGADAASSSDINWEALEQKNKSRKKFGLAPLTPEEFVRLESRVQAMVAEQQVKQQQQAAATAAQEEQARQQKRNGGSKNNMLDKLFGNVLKDTCESNFDCERPEVCCDFGFKKMCCSSGSPVLGQTWEPAMVPVPVETKDPWDYPQQQGGRSRTSGRYN